MSREILFRGKRKDNGEWVDGYYAIIKKKSVIIKSQAEDYYSVDDSAKKSHGNEVIEVDSENICQYTGLTDKYGRKIFEGDIVKESFDDCIGIVKYGEYGEYGFGYYIDWKSRKARFCREDILYWVKEVRIDVIGNIYDNPELLETEE